MHITSLNLLGLLLSEDWMLWCGEDCAEQTHSLVLTGGFQVTSAFLTALYIL